MYGNLLSNRQITQLKEAGQLFIGNFNPDSLRTTHYTLHPGRVLHRQEDGKWVGVHNFGENSNPYVLEKDKYVVVEVKEQIQIRVDGIAGHFITASSNIEDGLLIVAGQIGDKYGSNGEMLRFGVKNLLEGKNHIDSNTRLAHVEFFDLRGVTLDPIKLSSTDELIRAIRRVRAVDDGPLPE